MNLLALHELIAGTGDGLHPDLLRVLEERARIEFDPAVASLAAKTGRPVQAGPSLSGKAGLFVPGNVTRLPAQPITQNAATPSRIKA